MMINPIITGKHTIVNKPNKTNSVLGAEIRNGKAKPNKNPTTNKRKIDQKYNKIEFLDIYSP